MATTADRSPADTRGHPRAAGRWANNVDSPVGIALAGLGGAGLAMAGFVLSRSTARPPVRAGFLLLAAVGVQLRLLCDRRRASVAETSPSVRLAYELIDRVADVMVFAGVGICAGGTEGPLLGLGAGVGCLMTAHVRVLGAWAGAARHDAGPCAKAHRMAVLTAACLVGAVLVFFTRRLHQLMDVTLVIVCVGCVWTCVKRLRLIAGDLRTP